MRSFVSIFILLLLLLPLLALFGHFQKIYLPLNGEVAEVFAMTALQAALSAVAAMILGLLGGTGLIWAGGRFSTRTLRLIESLAFLPNAAPVLLFLLAALKFFPGARGLPGLVLVHAALNIGLVSVAFAELVRAKVAGPAELAWIEGCSGPRFFLSGAWPILRGDLGLLFLFLFALFFASFAVPLMIGGSRATTVEVLIYQKIRISGDWSEAMGLATLQMLTVLFFSWFLKGRSSVVAFRKVHTPLLSWPPGLAIALIPSLVLVLGLFDGVVAGIFQLKNLPLLLDDLPDLVTGSMLVGFGTGLLMLMLLILLGFARPQGFMRKILVGYAAPSSVLIGFGLLVFWRSFGLATYFKITLGLCMITLPAFYRYQWDALLRSLEGQVTAARTLGASDLLIFSRLVLPQIFAPACRLSGLASVWAWGDFALSGVVAERAVTVPMAVHGLMSAYRFEAATTLTWIVVLGGLLTFATFVGAGNVLGSQTETRL